MISIQSYAPTIHLGHIEAWLKDRDLDPAMANDLPHMGFVAVSDTGVVVGAGFLRQCEGSYGLVDAFITNPRAPAPDRNEALDGIVKKLVETAKAHNIMKLLAFTVDAGILERAKQHGFAHLPHTFMVLEGSK